MTYEELIEKAARVDHLDDEFTSSSKRYEARKALSMVAPVIVEWLEDRAETRGIYEREAALLGAARVLKTMMQA